MSQIDIDGIRFSAFSALAAHRFGKQCFHCSSSGNISSGHSGFGNDHFGPSHSRLWCSGNFGFDSECHFLTPLLMSDLNHD
jgi:hypothetical protein